MSHEEVIVSLKDILAYGQDPEVDHETADDILCEFLSELGYDDVVNLYQQVHKWYA